VKILQYPAPGKSLLPLKSLLRQSPYLSLTVTRACTAVKTLPHASHSGWEWADPALALDLALWRQGQFEEPWVDTFE